MAAFLGSTGRCNLIQVSIDGSMPITHDSFRGEGSFYRLANGLKLLLKHQLPAAVRVTIHRQNVRDLEEVSKLLLEDVGLPGFPRTLPVTSDCAARRPNRFNLPLKTGASLWEPF